ncbi:hypothetical protein KY092_16365 [Natronomonas gomsonensis]|uniref:hypothetical protein n=1 Tax=Natronomonas gomsonensis TaxID=1046043 RepID=UPI00227D1085|nr:hypothetical protein [Natronomonas gomsonensis]MCY4732135.1 hypothetical protein [Natronomonas gomsonensis]
MNTLQGAFDSLRQFEKRHSLFEMEIEGIKFWEYIRPHIYNEIKSSGTKDRLFPKKKKTTKIMELMKNVVINNPIAASESDYLFIGHPRRKLQKNGYWWDIYSDTIINQMEVNYIYAERPYYDTHKQPAETDQIYYLDLYDYTLSGLFRQLETFHHSLSGDNEEKIIHVQRKLSLKFNIKLDLKKMVEKFINYYKVKKRVYRWWFRRINPNIIVIVVNSGNRIRIKAAKEENIPVVELQHGVVHKRHVAYNYPSNTTIESFPDYFLCYGEFWKQLVDLPIPDSRVIPIGYPHMDRQLRKYKNKNNKDQILFISQGGRIGRKLSKLAVKLRNKGNISFEIVYKLHPGEYDGWRKRYPWLAEADIEVVDSSVPQLYKLFSESNIQIGIGSTAVYEGLAFDLNTFVYNTPESDILNPLVENGDAALFSSVDELISLIGSSNSGSNTSCYYFSPNSVCRMAKTLKELSNNGTLYK